VKFSRTSVITQERPIYPGTAIDLSIVVVSWNTQELLQKCLNSIYTNPAGVSFEIWVVDNNSIDGSVNMVQQEFPEVKLIKNPTNFGFAQANNQAIRRSVGRYVLLLNPDTRVKSGALATLVDYLDASPQVGAAGPRLLNPDGSLQVSCHPRPTLTREIWRLCHLDTLRPYAWYPQKKWNLEAPQEIDVLMGACLMVRREALNQVGLLDEDYFIYSEEVDLCYRIQKAGWRLYWVPGAEVVHYGGQSTRQAATEMFLHLYRSKIIYFRKNYGWPAVGVYKTILLFASLARLLLTPLVLLEASAQRHQHLSLSHRYGRLLLALPGM
jgi:GT2 family glycosyltransferase